MCVSLHHWQFLRSSSGVSTRSPASLALQRSSNNKCHRVIVKATEPLPHCAIATACASTHLEPLGCPCRVPSRTCKHLENSLILSSKGMQNSCVIRALHGQPFSRLPQLKPIHVPSGVIVHAGCQLAGCLVSVFIDMPFAGGWPPAKLASSHPLLCGWSAGPGRVLLPYLN